MLFGSLGRTIRRWTKRILLVSSIIAAALLVLSVFFSLAYYSSAHLPNWVIAASGGQGYLAWRHQQSTAPHTFSIERRKAEFRWELPSFKNNKEFTEILFPLWMPFALFGLPAGYLLHRDLNRPRPGTCERCGYDLTGNVSGRCPECGKDIPKETRNSRRIASATRSSILLRNTITFTVVMTLWILAARIRTEYQLIVLPYAVDPQGKYTPAVCRLSVAEGCLIARLNRVHDELRSDGDWRKWKNFQFDICDLDLGFVLPRFETHQRIATGKKVMANIVLPFWPVVVILFVPRLVSVAKVLRRTPRRLGLSPPQSSVS